MSHPTNQINRSTYSANGLSPHVSENYRRAIVPKGKMPSGSTAPFAALTANRTCVTASYMPIFIM